MLNEFDEELGTATASTKKAGAAAEWSVRGCVGCPVV
jgi:hypothetical protein